MSPRYEPTASDGIRPRRMVLPRGTQLFRTHLSQFGATEFNPNLAPRDLPKGGRFDATDADPYEYLYAARNKWTSLRETVLRNIERGSPLIPLLFEVQLRERHISLIRTTEDLTLVTLRSRRDLRSIGQDAWLTNAPESDVPITRQWASAIRGKACWAHGFAWRSSRVRSRRGISYIFFGDRCSSESFDRVEQLDLGSDEETRHIRRLLRLHGIR